MPSDGAGPLGGREPLGLGDIAAALEQEKAAIDHMVELIVHADARLAARGFTEHSARLPLVKLWLSYWLMPDLPALPDIDDLPEGDDLP